MGQRHQIFIKIVNPVKHIMLKGLTKEFGTKEYSIFAYHNQWLYGRSALGNAISLLKFGSQFTKEQKTEDTMKHSAYDCPFSPSGMKSNWQTPEKITTAIAFIMNFRPVKTAYLDAGIGRSWYIGNEEGINFDFTLGDNNDGITIIDLIENKYCFMNIYDHEAKGHDVRLLPSLKPVSATDYVRAYYGETKGTINDYYIKDKTPKQVKEVLSTNVKLNAKCYKPFEEFEVLTLNEIGEMFPDMEMFKPEQKRDKITLF